MDSNYILLDGELYHHGVKGQRWGFRRYQNKDGTLTPAGKKRYNSEMKKLREEQTVIKNKIATKAKIDKLSKMKSDIEEQKKSLAAKPEDQEPQIKSKSVKKMSEAELKERIARLDLEKKCKDLEKSTTSRGKAFVMDVLEASGKNIATQLTTYAMGTMVNKVAEKAGIKNATKTVKDAAGVETVQKIFEDLVNPRKGQKDK